MKRNLHRLREWERRSRKPLKRTSGLKRTGKLSTTSTNPDRRKRTRTAQKKRTGDLDGFGPWLRRLPCVGCYATIWKYAEPRGVASWSATPHTEKCDVAHLVTQGAKHGIVTARPTKCGQPAGTPCVLPLCRFCHTDQEGRTTEFFAKLGVCGWRVARILSQAFAYWIETRGKPA